MLDPFILMLPGFAIKAGLLLVLLVGIYLLLAGAFPERKRKPWRYLKKPLLTPNELEFFGRLIQAVPEYYVFPQVAMSQLIQIGGTFSKQTRMRGFNTIGRKVVDFVICDKTFKTLVLVELDDRTHNAAKDRTRDAMTREAGYETLRFESRDKPSVRELRQALRKYLG